MRHSCGALVVESSRLLLPCLRQASKLVRGVLYVPLSEAIVCQDTAGQGATSPPDLALAAHTIRQAYCHVAEVSPSLELRFILPHSASSSSSLPGLRHSIDVVMSPAPSLSALGKSLSYQLLSQRVSMTSADLCEIFQSLTPVGEEEIARPPESLTPITPFDHVALGGTFDHMHVGHHLLLTESLLLAQQRLLVGVADGPLLRSKVLPELIAPVEKRVGDVQAFLEDVKCDIQHEVVPISDVFGPTAWDDKLQCLVVTTDTARGGDKVNKERKRKGLSPLVIHMASLVGSKVSSGGVVSEEEKLSSSDMRRALLGVWRKPLVDECLEYNPQSGPFIIGLTGAMATGKSTVLRRLVEKGAYPIDCDKLGHETYAVGGPAYERVISEFGEGVRGEGGEIDRRALATAVFTDKTKLECLNRIVWPEIWKLVEVKVQEAWWAGHRVCVVDAAVLVMADWHRRVHQVWATLAPRSELVRRVMERNRVSEEEAVKRLAAQPLNQMYVDHAHMVIGTQWDPEVTRGQLEKAWLQVLDNLSQQST